MIGREQVEVSQQRRDAGRAQLPGQPIVVEEQIDEFVQSSCLREVPWQPLKAVAVVRGMADASGGSLQVGVDELAMATPEIGTGLLLEVHALEIV